MTGFTAVLLYAAWMPLLTIVYAGYRIPLVLTMRKRARFVGPRQRPRMIRRSSYEPITPT